MYKSPITELLSSITTAIATAVDNDFITAVQGVGFDVNKEELAKALAYDRGQYEKGFSDAKAEYEARWTPCSDALPEEFVYVLVCLTDGKMCVAQLTDYIDIWGEPKWCTDTSHTLGGAILSSEIAAWMPLPEPYVRKDNPQTERPWGMYIDDHPMYE